jgi:hypothetical protein
MLVNQRGQLTDVVYSINKSNIAVAERRVDATAQRTAVPMLIIAFILSS